MKTLSNIGKYILVIPLMIFGLFHFMNAEGMSGMVPIPGGVIWVYFTGAALIAGGIGILFNKKAKLAAQLFGLMVLLFALLIHLPGAIDGDQMATGMFLKDTAIAGGLWFLSGHLKD